MPNDPLKRILALSKHSPVESPAEKPQAKTSQTMRIGQFASSLRGIRSKAKIAEACKAFVSELRDTLEKKTPGALSQALFRTREAVAGRLGAEHPAILMLCSEPVALAAGVNPKHIAGQSLAEINQLRRRVRRRVSRYRHTQIPIASPAALVRRAVETARLEIHNQSGRFLWEHTLLGLMLLTGRRPVELAMTGHFAPSKRGSQWALFSGLAKTKGRNVPAFDIPLLGLPYRDVSLLLRRLRRHCPKFRDKRHCHNMVSANLHFATSCFFADNVTRPYDMRAVYARLTYIAFAPENQTDLAWFAAVLGHIRLTDSDDFTDTASELKSAERADTVTAANYQRYYVPSKKVAEARKLSGRKKQ